MSGSYLKDAQQRLEEVKCWAEGQTSFWESILCCALPVSTQVGNGLRGKGLPWKLFSNQQSGSRKKGKKEVSGCTYLIRASLATLFTPLPLIRSDFLTKTLQQRHPLKLIHTPQTSVFFLSACSSVVSIAHPQPLHS